jgi:hypothetical protein
MRFFLPGAVSAFFAIFFSCCALSCAAPSSETAILWTDKPEFALYAEYFNTSQYQYKVEVRYFESPAGGLNGEGAYPDIIIGNWLKSSGTRTLFKPLDDFFKNGIIDQGAFYPRLLSLGSIERKQYLFPVSFNAPALIFAGDKDELLSNPFTIGFEEIKELGKNYNIEKDGIYSRMGFSPAWNDEFLFIAASLFNASFKEAAPIAWDAIALERAMQYIYDWILNVNTSFQMEEEFAFKYFFDPPAKLVLSGRILFTYMNSADIFTLAGESRTNLDFRWIAENNTIPLSEAAVYYGIYKKGRSKKAANAFTRWFFQAETQRGILEKSRNNRLLETSFGIAGGFSALRTVTDQIFPQFYPSLLGRIPPGDFLSPANILPQNWTSLKERVILPYLHERVRCAGREEIRPLERRISEWYRLNSR